MQSAKLIMRSCSKHNQSGQSFVEFLTALLGFTTLFFLMVRLSLGMGVANYIQYATFMAARAYQSAHLTEAFQVEAANQYLEKFLFRNGNNRFRNIIYTREGEGDLAGVFVGKGPRVANATAQSWPHNWQQGVKFTFSVKMHMIPVLPGAARGAANQVQLESQSWLGREPTQADCEMNLSKQANQFRIGMARYDNGC